MNKHVDHGLVAEQSVTRAEFEFTRPRPRRVSPPPGVILTLPLEALERHPINRTSIAVTGPRFRRGRFANNLHDALRGNCAGYGFAINQGGQRVRSGGGGFRQLAQNPGDNLPMTSSRRMHTASVSKTLTATCVLKALRDRGLDTGVSASEPMQPAASTDAAPPWRASASGETGLESRACSNAGPMPLPNASKGLTADLDHVVLERPHRRLSGRRRPTDTPAA
ncbi:serine hydrolase [Roseivivax halodurans]|uniref:serine hydrolase n=1 Tax=Roseivivax halodurans TaxID=93683 RepID=UPI0009FDAB5C|nr:serine hydrolase [Roseivivax halodurans]